MKFILGGVVFEIKIQAFLKDVFDDKREKVATKPPEKPKDGEAYHGGCMFELRP